MIERDWISKFYSECGRELSLAYNVLNHTNNWGITLVTAVLASSFIGSVRMEESKLIFLYPTIYHWCYIIVAWVILLRFFIRSALALLNMYRWNTLIIAISKVLSITPSNVHYNTYVNNLSKKIDAYYYKWQSPIPIKKLLFENFRLMYIWFFIILLALFIWGIIVLEKNGPFFIGVCIYVIPTAIEIFWFIKYKPFRYRKLELEKEPEIISIWRDEKMLDDNNINLLVFGFCKDGPYKYAEEVITNSKVNWMPWSYGLQNIEPSVVERLSKGFTLKNKKVGFASWHSGFTGKKRILRFGIIDHFGYSQDSIRVTVKLESLLNEKDYPLVKITNPVHLLFPSTLGSANNT